MHRLLIDQSLGRSIDTRYGLKCGLLDILVKAKEQGLIPAAKPILDRPINEEGFRVIQGLHVRTPQESGE